MTLWQFTALKNSLKKEGWELTKEITDKYGPPAAAGPRAFDEVSLPRGSMRNKNRIPETVRSDESTIPDPQIIQPPTLIAEDGYEADDDKNRNKPEPRGTPDEIEMRELNGSRSPPAYESDPTQEDPHYAQVDKSKKKVKGAVNSDSWVQWEMHTAFSKKIEGKVH